MHRRSNAHGHDDVLIVVAAGHCDERAGIGVAECEAHALARKILQGIQQIGDVEADIKFFALIRNLELQRIWSETHKTVLFITHSIPMKGPAMKVFEGVWQSAPPSSDDAVKMAETPKDEKSEWM